MQVEKVNQFILIYRSITNISIFRFSLPTTLISDNGKQFSSNNFIDFYTSLGIKQRFTFVEHPQTNDQAKLANQVMLDEPKKWLNKAKGQWVEELPNALWSY